MARTTWAHRATDSLVRALAGTRVTPNHLTALRAVTGVAAAWHFAHGAPAWGGALFVLSAFLDRADGELARQNGQTSRLGHYLDVGSDISINALLFIGIGAGLRQHSWLGPWSLALGLAAGIAIVLIFLLVARLERQGVTAFTGTAGFDPDDVLFLVGPIAWLGALPWFLLAGAVGAPIFLAFLLVRWPGLLAASDPRDAVHDPE